MIDPAALKIANEGYTQFREKQKRYIHTEANRDTLIKFLKEKQLSLSDWNINAWMLAFGMCEDQLMMELPASSKPRLRARSCGPKRKERGADPSRDT